MTTVSPSTLSAPEPWSGELSLGHELWRRYAESPGVISTRALRQPFARWSALSTQTLPLLAELRARWSTEDGEAPRGSGSLPVSVSWPSPDRAPERAAPLGANEPPTWLNAAWPPNPQQPDAAHHPPYTAGQPAPSAVQPAASVALDTSLAARAAGMQPLPGIRRGRLGPPLDASVQRQARAEHAGDSAPHRATSSGSQQDLPVVRPPSTVAPDAARPTVAPDAARKTLGADAAHQTLALDAARQTIAPDAARRTVAPDAARRTVAPDAARRTVAPDASRQTLAAEAARQSLTRQSVAPDVVRRTALGPQTVAPDAARQTFARQTVAPDAVRQIYARQTVAPDAARQTLARRTPAGQRARLMPTLSSATTPLAGAPLVVRAAPGSLDGSSAALRLPLAPPGARAQARTLEAGGGVEPVEVNGSPRSAFAALPLVQSGSAPAAEPARTARSTSGAEERRSERKAPVSQHVPLQLQSAAQAKPPAERAASDIDLDDLVERLLRRLSRRLSIESERRGWSRWRS